MYTAHIFLSGDMSVFMSKFRTFLIRNLINIVLTV